MAEYASAAGFEDVFLEDLTFGQQVETFQTASSVFGAHGAGLANMLFGKAMNVFEYNSVIKKETKLREHFRKLSAQLGHNYHLVDDRILENISARDFKAWIDQSVSDVETIQKSA